MLLNKGKKLVLRISAQIDMILLFSAVDSSVGWGQRVAIFAMLPIFPDRRGCQKTGKGAPGWIDGLMGGWVG